MTTRHLPPALYHCWGDYYDNDVVITQFDDILRYPLPPTHERRQHYFSVFGGGDSHCFYSIFKQAGINVVPFVVFLAHNMAHVPPIYTF
jgi:hypothetical protein